MEGSTLHAFARAVSMRCVWLFETTDACQTSGLTRALTGLVLAIFVLPDVALADGRTLSDAEYARLHAQTESAFGITPSDEVLPGQRRATDVAASQGVTSPAHQRVTPSRFELLLIERRPMPKASTARLADVYVYDYSREQLVHRVVDPLTGAVEYEEALVDQQLPLTSAEINRAQQILFSDASSLATLEQLLVQAANGATALTSLQFKAVVFIADTSESGNARRCGRMRCAELLIYTADEQIALDVRPVIGLANNRVLALRQLRTGGVQ